MMEHIISDERLAHINRAAYRAGLSADEVYTQMGADGTILKGSMMMANVDPSGFCAWGERGERANER